MDKLLTVIIPTYNMEDYLDTCLSSLIVKDEELMSLLEVLVVNDGSKDNSSQIAHIYEGNYPQIFKVIDKENGNYGSCINRGLLEARGRYIKVLDADDCFDTEALGVFLCKLGELDVDLVVTDGCNYLAKKHKRIYWRVGCIPNEELPVAELPSIWMHTITYKTNNLRRMNYHQTEGISFTDEEWAFWPMNSVKTFYYLPVCLYCYTLERDGQSVDATSWIKKINQEIQLSRPMIKFLHNAKDTEPAYSYFQRKLFTRLRHFYSRIVVEYGIPLSQEIVTFDRFFMEQLPEMYEQLADDMVIHWRIPIHYMRYWRSHGYNISPYHPYGIIIKGYKLWKELKSCLNR